MFSEWSRKRDDDVNNNFGYKQNNNFDREYADSMFTPNQNSYHKIDRTSRFDRNEENAFNNEEKPFSGYPSHVEERKKPSLFKRERHEAKTLTNQKTTINKSIGNNVVIYSPNTFKDVKKLIDYLKNSEPVIVDLANIKHDKGQRILDFLSGAIYAVNGSLHKISGTIYLLTPAGVSIMVPYDLQQKIKGDKK